MQHLTLRLFIGLIAGFIFNPVMEEQNRTEVSSPDSDLKVVLTYNDSITYRVIYKNREIISPSVIAMDIDGKSAGRSPKILKKQARSVSKTIRPLYGKFDTLDDTYNEARIDFKGDYSLLIRVYNEAACYRFISAMDSPVIINNETATFTLSGDPSVLFPETTTYTSWEVAYVNYQSASAIDENKKAITPVLFAYPDGTRVVIAESDVYSYPGMYLLKGKGSFMGTFAAYPDSVAMGSWGNFVSVVQRRAGYIAKTDGNREFPWRVIIVTDDDKSLLTNEVIYKLAKPQAINDVSWIKPGKATWEWWHDAMLPGADIPSGMDNRNTGLYKYYIDFAARHGLEYLMLDAGWSDIFDLSKVNRKINIQEIIDHGRSCNVGVFLWCVAPTLVKDADRYMKLMADWGAAGIKVDFFDRDDQLAMEWMEYIAKKAAEYKLMVNFHGCSKPSGLQRTYPNIVNYEAVRGAECSKWDLTANPEQHLIFPFIRMLTGSIDYTPGSIRNRSQQMFKPIDPGLPLTQGTRCHELAMYVVFDQYFAMLCDSPTEYEKYPDIMKFLSAVPVTFDETKVLAATVGDYALIAKRKGSDWYVGGMTDWTARNAGIDFSFLASGVSYTAEIYADDFDSNIYADRYKYETRKVDSVTKLTIGMASGGGVAIRVYPHSLK